MRVEFLLILLFEAEEELNGDSTESDISSIGDDDLGSTFEYVGLDFFAGNCILCYSFGVDSHELEYTQSSGIDDFPAIGDYADYDLFPGVATPGLRAVSGCQVGDVLDYGVQSACDVSATASSRTNFATQS